MAPAALRTSTALMAPPPGVRVEWVRYGRPAAEALRVAILEAKGDEPLTPVTVVVPSNHVGVATRRLLASGELGPTCGQGTGLVSVTFVTPYRLAELHGGARLAAEGRRPVSTPVIAAALRAALADDPGLLAPVAAHPATESALVEAYRELRDLSPAALEALGATSARAADVVRLHSDARARLRSSWYDEQDLTTAAADALLTGNGDSVGALIIYLPQRLSLHSARLLTSCALRSGALVLCGATGDPRADAEVAASVARLGSDCGPPHLEASDVASVERTRFVTVSDADEEVRVAVRAVVDAVRAGTRLDRIAILHASPLPYARLVHEHLSAAGVPANGAAVMPLAARVAGRTLLHLLDLPAGGFRRQDVFAWLAGAPVRSKGRSAPVTAWERLSRQAAVVAGRTNWDRFLSEVAHQRDAAAALAEADPEAPAWRAERLRTEAERARDLRSFVLELIDDLTAAGSAPRRWKDHVRWAKTLLTDLLGGAGTRGRWPHDERTAADRLDLALDRLAALDSVEGAVPLDVFTRTLEVELEADLGRVGRFGEGVLVGSVGMGVGLDLDLVVVLGLSEGSFPSAVREDSLLPDDERETTAGELPLRAQRVERQHRELLAALSSSRRHVLCVPRGDLRRSSERVPSRWALDLASALAGQRWWSDDFLSADRPWLEHVASFTAGIRTAAFPSTLQEHHLRSLLADQRATPRGLVGAADSDPVPRSGAEVLSARASTHFTRFDGNLAGLVVPSPANGVTSATRLERWASCPFGYLLQNVLGVEQVDNPEEELSITALTRGSLVHDVLERFMLDALDRPSADRIRPEQPWPAADRARMVAIAEQLFAEYEGRGLTGRPIFWRRDRERILSDLLRFLDLDDVNRRLHRLEPLAAELAFGFGSGVEAVPIELPDGRAVRFRGMADRVDVAGDGTLHVVDYKTGSSDSFKGLGEDDPDLGGRKLQLPVYGVAARLLRAEPDAPVLAEYWFVSTKGKFGRIGYRLTPELLEHVGRTLGTVVAGIEAGVFPAFPATPNPRYVACDPCDPDGLGVSELFRAWARKRSDPALAIFASLVDPQAGSDPSVEETRSD